MGVFQDFNQSALDYLRNVDLQHKCKFEFSIIRNPFASVGASGVSKGVQVFRTVTGAAGLASDVLISKFFLKSLTFPTGIGFEIERVNNTTYPKAITYPEGVTMTFIDSEAGLVRRYITEWMQAIAKPYQKPGLSLSSFIPFAGAFGSSPYDPKQDSYEFEDNMKAAKRDAILILKPKDSKTPIYPRVMFYGLLPKAHPQLEVMQDSADPIEYSIEFTVDNIKVPVGI